MKHHSEDVSHNGGAMAILLGTVIYSLEPRKKLSCPQAKASLHQRFVDVILAATT